MKHLVFILIIIAVLPCTGFTQATDNSGKDLFVVKTTDGLSFPITSTGISINFTSSFDKEDTVEITIDKYNKEKEKYDELIKSNVTPRKVPFFDQSQNKYFVIIHRRGNSLKSYYFPQTLAGIAKRLDTSSLKNIRSLNQRFLYSDFNDSVKAREFVGFMDSLKIPTDTIYSVTDIGTGLKPFFINFKVSNLSIKSLGQFFTNSNQPTIQIELGAIQNSVLKFNDWNELKKATGFLGFHEYDLFYSIYVNTNCIDYIDTTNQQRTAYDWKSLTRFMQYGTKANLNAYISKHFAVALTANFWYGLPLDNDKSFQKGNPQQILRNDTLYKSIGQSSGKYGGDINQKLLNARLSISLPIFFDLSRPIEWLTGISQPKGSKFYLLPSYAPFISTGLRWKSQVGISINLLSQPYGEKNSSIVQAGGLGFDLLSNSKAKTGWGSPIFYISGTINLGSIVSKNGSLKAKK